MLEWTKTILSVYRYLEKVTNAIDKIVDKRAENSSGYYGDYYNFNSVYKICDSILELTERKIKLINLKLICEQALESLDPFLARILISTYFDNRKSRETAELMNISMRTFFRKIKIALHSFSSSLKKLGYNDDAFNEMLKGENWIINLKQKLNKTDEIFLLDKKYFKLIFDDYNNSSCNRQIRSNPIF